MGTRSTVTVKVGDRLKVIYCHWDGYPSNNGGILLNHYNTQEKVEALVSFGNLSVLGNNTDDTVFYDRDRDEEDQEARSYHMTNGIDDSELQEYNYFWDGKKWFVHGHEYQQCVELTEEICKE